MMAGCVLDASALLAVVHEEPGGEAVGPMLTNAAISAVNWSEVVQRARNRDLEIEGLRTDVEAAGVAIVAFRSGDAEAAASLWLRTRQVGLGLADRACLALAEKLGVPALTADRSWAALDLDIEIVTIR